MKLLLNSDFWSIGTLVVCSVLIALTLAGVLQSIHILGWTAVIIGVIATFATTIREAWHYLTEGR